MKQGNRQKAIEHYTIVAGGQGEIAEAAGEALVRLDLADNPDKYIQVRCYQDNSGNLGLSIGNATPLTVTGVRYAVQYRDTSGTGTRVREGAVRGEIRPGTAVKVSTGIGPYPAGSGCPVQITAARVAE